MTTRTFVHVFATFGAGGPQVRALQLMAQLGAGVRHVVMAMDGCTDAAAQVPAGITFELAPPLPRAGFLASARALRRWLVAKSPDLVLTYNWGAIEAVAAARRARLPLVHHEDGFLPDEAQRRLRRRSWLRRLLLRRVPVVVPSAVLARIATAEWRLPAATVHHLPNGVDLARFQPATAPPAEPRLGTVGGLRAEKDHTTLLRALALLPEPVGATIVGGGALAGELHAQVHALGLQHRVELAGAVTDTAAWYRRFTVFVLSSRTEQMPLVLLEAMASGLPVVATDVGDVRVVLPESAAPFVVPPGSPQALATALQRLLADAGLRSRLGADNRSRVQQRFGAAACLQRFVDVYDAAARR